MDQQIWFDLYQSSILSIFLESLGLETWINKGIKFDVYLFRSIERYQTSIRLDMARQSDIEIYRSSSISNFIQLPRLEVYFQKPFV